MDPRFGVEPFNTFAFFPEPELNLFAWYRVVSKSVLFSAPPIPLVHAAVGPGIDAVALLFIIFILAFILSAVLPGVNADTVHVVVNPLATILATIQPCVRSDALYLIFLPLAVVA